MKKIKSVPDKFTFTVEFLNQRRVIKGVIVGSNHVLGSVVVFLPSK